LIVKDQELTSVVAAKAEELQQKDKELQQLAVKRAKSFIIVIFIWARSRTLQHLKRRPREHHEVQDPM
jgi:predicted GTPase